MRQYERARRGGFKQNGTDSPRTRAVEQFTYASDPIQRLEVLEHAFLFNAKAKHAITRFTVRLDAYNQFGQSSKTLPAGLL